MVMVDIYKAMNNIRLPLVNGYELSMTQFAEDKTSVEMALFGPDGGFVEFKRADSYNTIEQEIHAYIGYEKVDGVVQGAIAKAMQDSNSTVGWSDTNINPVHNAYWESKTW